MPLFGNSQSKGENNAKNQANSLELWEGVQKNVYNFAWARGYSQAERLGFVLVNFTIFYYN